MLHLQVLVRIVPGVGLVTDFVGNSVVSELEIA